MTACNLIVRPEAAYLICDTAHFADDGTVSTFQSKIVTSPRLRAAVAITGRASTGFAAAIDAWMRRQPSQSAALESLPGLLAELTTERDELDAAQGVEPGRYRLTMGLVLAMHSTATGKPEGYVIASDSTLHRGLQPMTSRRTGQFINPQVPGVFIGGWPFDPKADSCELLFRQRGTEHGETRRHIVGGSGELARVTATGVRVDTICRWPDRMGHRIDPTNTAEHGSRVGRLRQAFASVI